MPFTRIGNASSYGVPTVTVRGASEISIARSRVAVTSTVANGPGPLHPTLVDSSVAATRCEPACTHDPCTVTVAEPFGAMSPRSHECGLHEPCDDETLATESYPPKSSVTSRAARRPLAETVNVCVRT